MVVQWPSPETLWCAVLMVVMVNEVVTLSGPNVCMVQQKYNITKRVKYRAPMSVRTYEWCFAMPPRCSRWNTEMRDLTRLETEERTAEVAVCCPGYKMKDVSCVPICPSGKMGHGCNEDCPPDKWGPNCVNECPECLNGFCVPSTGECDCEEGWQGESCQISMSTVQVAPALMEELLTTTKSTIKTLPTTKSTAPTTRITELSTPRVTHTDTSTTSTPSTTTTVKSTKVTLTSTSKTETTTQLTQSTSFFIYSNATSTPFTTEFFESKTTDLVPKVTVTNFIYNRTETPEEGTSNTLSNFSNEHETSTMLNPISIKSSMAPLSSPPTTTTDNPTTLTTTTTTPSTTSTTTSTSPTPTTATTSSTTTSKVLTTIVEDSSKIETTKKTETTIKNHFTTLKFKPKEIWIKPTQKGVPIHIETKVKNHETHAKFKSATHKNEPTSENTTPKTIIVSIIPTSVSHATFKKISLTTASYLSHKFNHTTKYNKTDQSFTKSMTSQVSTAIPFTIKLLSTASTKNSSSKASTRFPKSNATSKVTASTKNVFLNTTKFTSEKHSTTMATLNLSTATLNSTLPTLNTTMATSTTNSMSSTLNANEKLNSSTFLTIKPPTNKYTYKSSNEVTTASVIDKRVFVKDEAMITTDKRLHTNINDPKPKVEVNHTTTVKKVVNSNGSVKVEVTKTKGNIKYVATNNTKKVTTKWNITKTTTNNPVTTQEPIEDETFHILTEPEHITAVMNDKERDHTSVDLISVISIAGGVMMAIITVAVVIVMIERCKRPRYEDVRKVNDIRMQVMIDNKDPPPYVRSIFHTPLPEPPSSDNCHYQPISTLDRNLKQFMRPVVVQAISPIMLENFRGILECHYDHLPNRNHRIHEFGTMPTRCSVSPSMKCDEELLRHRPLSVADYTIESLKCEAKMDMIDNTTSEPLYAEIPCWRPPSEHAVEVMNLNGEAVTEL
ncbi:mucin-5AC-like isoform X2 [Maniola jurtina]|uniref:mucin-5AC-like isoform X2 n=1 Tax=Maniola jurtina TaxID=191418 RepID=UPI001E68F64D|nr:mucin-5AC-like isoform X2 [Maniola jurtina]